MRTLYIPLLWTILAIAAIPRAADAATTCEQWAQIFEQGTPPAINQIFAPLGASDKSYTDELLVLDIYEYELTGEGCREKATGKVYVSDGTVVGLSTVYVRSPQSRLGRFILEHYDEVLVLGDLTAIAGARENCAEYRAITATAESEEILRISASLYEKMVAVGDLPPIPAENARKGYAA